MAGDTAAALEQLIPRFEALRSSGAIKLLVIEHQPGAGHLEELPPLCQPFTRASLIASTAYGTAEGTGRRVYASRWLGKPEQLEEMLTAIDAAGLLLAVPLAKAGLINPADYLPPRDLASRCGWLVAMLAAAEQGFLQADGMAGGNWRHWVPGGGIACDSATVQLYRSKAAAEQLPNDLMRMVAEAVDTSARFAIVKNVVESSLALLRHLAAPPAEARKAKADKPQWPKKPFHNLTECIKHIYSTAGGRDRIRSCGTMREACDYIQQEFPGQRVSAPGLKGSWPENISWPWGKKKHDPGRTVVVASRLGEHFDLDTFEARQPQPSALVGAPTLKCATCGDEIPSSADCLKVGAKLCCRECGEELLLEENPRHLQKSRSRS